MPDNIVLWLATKTAQHSSLWDISMKQTLSENKWIQERPPSHVINYDLLLPLSLANPIQMWPLLIFPVNIFGECGFGNNCYRKYLAQKADCCYWVQIISSEGGQFLSNCPFANIYHLRCCQRQRHRHRHHDICDPDGIVLPAERQNGSRTQLSEICIRKNIIKNCIGNISFIAGFVFIWNHWEHSHLLIPIIIFMFRGNYWKALIWISSLGRIIGFISYLTVTTLKHIGNISYCLQN